jgi:hypothetical protein
MNRQVTWPEQNSSGSYLEQNQDEKNQDYADWPNNIVTWNGPDDPQSSMNWSIKKKLSIKVLLGFTTMGAAFGSSFSPTFMAVSEEFGVSEEVTILTLSLYVLGFAFGPLVCTSDYQVGSFQILMRYSCLLLSQNCMEGSCLFFQPTLSLESSLLV